jgi:hypothetical protein
MGKSFDFQGREDFLLQKLALVFVAESLVGLLRCVAFTDLILVNRQS